MKKISIAIAAIGISFMMLAMSAAPVLADENVTRTIDMSGTASQGFGQNGNGNGGEDSGGDGVLSLEFNFYLHTSIPYPIGDDGIPANMTLDGVLYDTNIWMYDLNVDDETFVVEFADGQILEGTMTNYVCVNVGWASYDTTADITLSGPFTIDGEEYNVDLSGTFHRLNWPLSGVGPS